MTAETGLPPGEMYGCGCGRSFDDPGDLELHTIVEAQRHGAGHRPVEGDPHRQVVEAEVVVARREMVLDRLSAGEPVDRGLLADVLGFG